MKTIGLIGGMSWESSVLYYRLINTGIKQRLGGLHSAQLLMFSVDFAPIEQLQHAGDWDGAAKILVDAARRLEVGGADFFLIGTNTMHRVADEIAAAVNIPLLHIADATAHEIKSQGLNSNLVLFLSHHANVKDPSSTTDAKWCNFGKLDSRSHTA